MSPRIPPIPPREWPAEMGAALAALKPANPRYPMPPRDDSRPKGLNILGTFAHHPSLAAAYHTFNGHLLFGTTLSLRQRELAILRVAAVRGAEYEWRQHLVLASDVGISDEEVRWIAEGPEAGGWQPFERALVSAVDELINSGSIADATWQALAVELDEKQLLDLIFTVGAYDTLAMVCLSVGVEPDADLPGNGLLA